MSVKTTMRLADPMEPIDEIHVCHHRIEALLDAVMDLVTGIDGMILRPDMQIGATPRTLVHQNADRAMTFLSMAHDLLGRAGKEVERESEHLFAVAMERKRA